ncbi:MAG: TatD family hydrolase [Dehalogenimonas sp.]
MPVELIDSHAHLDLPEFESDFDEILNRAEAAGIRTIITIGTDLSSSKKAVRLAENHRSIYATVGIHPTDSAAMTLETQRELAALAQNPRVVAIGETGLDFYHKPFSESQQLETLKFQLELAIQVGKPVVVHSREADSTVLPILVESVKTNPNHLKGVIHCFNGTIDTARAYMNAGFYISLGGYVTYPSSRKSHEVYRFIPLDRLLLETDCPFLPPQSHRGQRNEPAYLVQTAQALGAIKEISFEDIAKTTAANTRKLFKLD